MASQQLYLAGVLYTLCFVHAQLGRLTSLKEDHATLLGVLKSGRAVVSRQPAQASLRSDMQCLDFEESA